VPAGVGSAGETLDSVRRFLELDRSLTPSERKVLERLLLRPEPASVRELAHGTGTNAQSLYVALERLEQRGLILRDRTSTGMTFRAGHPSAVLEELLGSWREAGELARRLEEPLRRLHEEREGIRSDSSTDRTFVTASLTACLGAMLHRTRAVRSEIWVVGRETAWWNASRALERELIAAVRSPAAPAVRLLIPAPRDDPVRLPVLLRLRAGGVSVRFSDLFLTPMVLFDRSAVFLRTGTLEEPEPRTDPLYVRLDAPELVADIARSCVAAWPRAVALNGETRSGSASTLGRPDSTTLLETAP
jgi:sugar-specific transcriptional regulator TrmB